IIPVDDNNDRTLEIVIPAVVGGIVVAICIVLSILILYKIKSQNSKLASATNEGFGMKKWFGVDDPDDAADGGDDGSGGGSGGS
uniref:Uncharacterized protein n=1 Tax=Amphimedon queenslandica TaxID=400682 RepID=A0A1X7SW73_AMPQE